MALPGDEIKVIDKASPLRGSLGRIVSGEVRGRYIVELQGTPGLQARVELTDAQFIVTRAADDPLAALRPFGLCARWYDEDLPDDFVGPDDR